MATNFHSDLPNNQIHSPKDFSIAQTSSVMSKDETGLLDWVFSPYDLSLEIICQPDVSGGLHGAYFLICSTETAKAEVSFSVTGETAPYTPRTSYTQVNVVIPPNETAINIASRIKTDFDALVASNPNFTFVTTVNGTGKVNVTNMRSAANAVDGDTDFSFNNTKSFSGEHQLFSNDSGVISFAPVVYDNSYTGFCAPRDPGIYIPAANKSFTNLSMLIGTSVPATLPIPIALEGAIYVANEKDSFKKFFGVINASGTFKFGLLSATVVCSVDDEEREEEAKEGGKSSEDPAATQISVITQQVIDGEPDQSICFEYTATKVFAQNELIIPFVQVLSEESFFRFTSRLLIDKFKN